MVKAKRSSGKKEKTKALVPTVEIAEATERKILVAEVEDKIPQLFSEAQRRLVMNETPRYCIKRRKGKGTLFFDYVDVSYVVEQLNYVFGFRCIPGNRYQADGVQCTNK